MFARSLKYVASVGCPEFRALIELARKKGGPPEGYVIYLYRQLQPVSNVPIFHEGISQIYFSGNEKELAEASFPYAQVRYCWKPATRWLYRVAVGGGYRQHPEGAWVKVGRPNPWKRRRRNRKLRLRFGELGHIILARKSELQASLKELYNLGFIRGELDREQILDLLDRTEVEYEDRLCSEEKDDFNSLRLEILDIERGIRGIKGEARFVRQRFFERRR